MFSGIYSGATALNNYGRQQELIASNLAHLNTPGYRRQLFTFQEKMSAAGAGSDPNPGAAVSLMATDFEPGARKQTGRPLDLAMGGDGFFTFQGESGTLYSRNGVLFRDPAGQLVNGDGLAILDQGQPIEIPGDVSDRDLVIDSSGQISANGNVLGTISSVQFDDNQRLDSESQIYFKLGNAIQRPATNPAVLQGARELSNSQPVTELVSLIVGSRHFESAQRAIRTISDTIQENIRS